MSEHSEKNWLGRNSGPDTFAEALERIKELESRVAEYVFESSNRQATRRVSKFEVKQCEKFKQLLGDA